MGSKVLVLGGNGMLGNAVVNRLAREDLRVAATARNPHYTSPKNVQFLPFTVGVDSVSEVVADLGVDDYVVNCAGLIKQRMDESSAADRVAAIEVNALFPYSLAAVADSQGFRVVQIATDCVFAGAIGAYDEHSSHDALDVYGKTKSLGEVSSARVLNLRCSIIGRELASTASLLEWLLNQPAGASVKGYVDHHWNGVTTSVFADIVAGIILRRADLHGIAHLVPADVVSKNRLLHLIAEAFDRRDITIVEEETGSSIDRSLATVYPETNQHLWHLGGFDSPPTIQEMIERLAAESG